MSFRRQLVVFAVLAARFATHCLASDVFGWQLPKGFPRPKVPVQNAMSMEKVNLGRHLFYDKRLSVNGKMSCATCHRQALAFTDGRAVAVGATGAVHPRSAMSLVNVAFESVLGWSNPNVHTLEDQALIPMLSDHPTEMGLRGREESILASFRADRVYGVLFLKAFPESSRPFTMVNVSKALACFERTIISARSPYDRYVSQGENGAISESAKRGELLFFNDKTAGCYRCHNGFNFSDATQAPRFHNTGLYNLAGVFSYPEINLGAYEFTRKLSDVGKFKTPSLRNVALTAPYMHDGSLATLDDVLDHYQAGGRTTHYGSYLSQGNKNPNKDPLMTGFTLTPQNRRDLIAFLETLTDPELLKDPRFSDPW